MSHCKYPVVGHVLKLLEEQDNSDISLNQLRELHMRNDSGARPEMELIKLLLAKSLMLENIFFCSLLNEDHERLRMLQELKRLGHASPK